MDRRRGPGRRRGEVRKAAEEGEISGELLEFIMAIDEYKRINERPFPTWSEIFEIVQLINREQNLSVLLVEQNALAALDVVSTGYLLENGRIVMHDSADALRRNPDIQEFYLGGAGGKDFHKVKHYSRRKRWLT